MTTHKTLCNAVRNTLGVYFPLHPNNSGVAVYDRIKIRYGWPPTGGGPDLLGIYPPHGRVVGIEIKTPGDRLRPKQLLVRDWIRGNGGVYEVIQAASVEDAKEQALGVLARLREENDES